ncbi:Queuine tRNA-ribosyltransferase subunit qtrtd1, partial [Rhizopus azygosporus]
MASAVNFHLAENSASNIIRRGALQFTKKNKTIQTPACLTYSLRGSVPHLVADNLKLLPIELVQISLEQFLEQKEPSSFKFPHGLHKYLHLENMLLFCDIRDPLKLSPVSFNTDKYLSVESHGGVRQVTPTLWAEALNIYRPDLIAAMADTVTDLEAKNKRIIRSVDRSLRWLDENLAKAKELDIPLFAHVLGHTNIEERARSARETAQRDVQGFVVNVLGLNHDQIPTLIRATVDNLPQDKPRLAYGLATPEKILEGISNGIDLFDGSYAYKATQKGRAITLNLWDPSFAHDFDPIDTSCGCNACSRPHTKAYIHHLLNAHEMLGPLLLMSHNIYQLDQFMAAI